jgi:hypothetical protein
MRECHNCNHRVMGLGCLLTNKRVTDHQHCDKWEPVVNRSIHDQPAIEQYRQAGYILDLGA